MSVLVFAEVDKGIVKKSSLEAVAYGAAVAQKINAQVAVLVVDDATETTLAALGKFGANKVLHVQDSRLQAKLAAVTAAIITAAAEAESASVVVMPKSSLVDAAAPRIGIRYKATVASNVTELPEIEGDVWSVLRSVYTGKAFAKVKLAGARKILTIKKNAIVPTEGSGTAAVSTFAPSIADGNFELTIQKVEKQTGDILLPEATRVVSAGRGLKGPENWGLIEDLAKTLGAATACSKPVSDMDWRPHHEHVGQTGIKISPDLYIAIGISGAIQHLAGVSSSKVIVVINKDAEAPFFKAADYGIIGDAFDVLPKLNDALKAVV